MRAPGVEVRPLRQMTGGASFNEVFFNEVRVPDDHRLGDVNQGWSVALTTLMNERASIGAGGAGGSAGGITARVIEMVRHFGLDDDPARARRAGRHHRLNMRWPATRTSGPWTRSSRASCPGPEMSIAKLALTKNMRRMSEFVAQVLGAEDHRRLRRVGHLRLGRSSSSACPGMRIAGGSDEVMRNIVGERVLGLPKDPGIDSTTPFRDLKVGTQKA